MGHFLYLRAELMKTNVFDTLLTRAIDAIYSVMPASIRAHFPRQVFRYGICGGGNVLFDWVLYFILYNFVIGHHNLSLPFVTLSPHIAALVFSTPVSFLSGFYLQRHISFPDSYLQRHTQLWRYFSVYLVNILLNYVFLKLFVDGLDFYPTPSKMLTTVIVTVFSFLAQKHFTFQSR